MALRFKASLNPKNYIFEKYKKTKKAVEKTDTKLSTFTWYLPHNNDSTLTADSMVETTLLSRQRSSITNTRINETMTSRTHTQFHQIFSHALYKFDRILQLN